MPSEELEREPTEDELNDAYMHGAYPQRVPDFSLGPQETWGWMQHLATTDTSSNQFGTFQEWGKIFQALAELEEPVDKEELAEMEKVYTECNRAAHMRVHMRTHWQRPIAAASRCIATSGTTSKATPTVGARAE